MAKRKIKDSTVIPQPTAKDGKASWRINDLSKDEFRRLGKAAIADTQTKLLRDRRWLNDWVRSGRDRGDYPPDAEALAAWFAREFPGVWTHEDIKSGKVTREDIELQMRALPKLESAQKPTEAAGGMFTVKELAQRHQVDNQRLAKRLARHRKNTLAMPFAQRGWVEIESDSRSDPKYLYAESAAIIRHIAALRG